MARKSYADLTQDVADLGKEITSLRGELRVGKDACTHYKILSEQLQEAINPLKAELREAYKRADNLEAYKLQAKRDADTSISGLESRLQAETEKVTNLSEMLSISGRWQGKRLLSTPRCCRPVSVSSWKLSP